MHGVAVSGALAFYLMASALIVPACADNIPPCPLPHGVTSTSLENAPPALLRALKERIGELVLPGDQFDATDVRWTGQNRRLIFIWNAGRRWVVATEHGGRGYNDPIFAYDLSQDGQRTTLVAERTAFSQTVCSTVNGLLNLP